MLKRSLALILLLVMALTLAAGCAGPSEAREAQAPEDQKVNLWFYYPTQVGGDLSNGMEKIVADFNDSHPEINVTAVYTGSYKQTAQKAMSDLAAGNGPNVILSGMLDILDYYNVNALEKMEPYLQQEGAEWSSDFVDGFWENFVMADGAVYGLPFQHSVCVLYYNQDMLEAAGVKAPENWQETLEAVSALQAFDSSVIPMEFPSDVWVLEALTLSNSGSLIESDTKTAFDSEPVVESLDLMSRLIQGGGMINSYAAAAEDFIAESCAMMLNTTGNLGFVSSDAQFNWDVAMVPVNTAPKLSYGGGGLVMTADQTEEEKAASWEFMKYMTSPEVSARWMTISGYFTVRKSADELPITKEYYAERPQLQKAAKLLEYTAAQWTTKRYWDVYGYMQTALDAVLIDGKTSARDALTTAQNEAKAILEE